MTVEDPTRFTINRGTEHQKDGVRMVWDVHENGKHALREANLGEAREWVRKRLKTDPRIEITTVGKVLEEDLWNEGTIYALTVHGVFSVAHIGSDCRLYCPNANAGLGLSFITHPSRELYLRREKG